MNYVSPSYDSAMRHPIKATADHGCAGNCQQGRFVCDCSHEVARIKSSTPLHITMEDDEGPGLFMSRVFWGLVAINLIGWGAVVLWKLSEWVRS